MDGNGRWAEGRKRPRSLGHQAGLKSARRVVRAAAELGVKTLTLFAFSSENWNRPPAEVRRLMELFLKALQREVDELDANKVCLTFIGDRTRLSQPLRDAMRSVEVRTCGNDGLNLVIAINYGGRWDIANAARQIAERVQRGELDPSTITEDTVHAATSVSHLSDPDLLIRTGGEKRISNFLLWQSAYTEFYFTDTLWPDFGPSELEQAVGDFTHRQRRFGNIDDARVADVKSA